ncbi:MAG: CBS domain-containing protein [Zavarzinella sp.]
MELLKNLKKDPVSRLQPNDPKIIDLKATVGDAVSLMQKENVGCVVICEAGKLVGLFTENDLMVRVLAVDKPLTTSIEEVMTSNPVTANIKDHVRTVVRKMKSGGYRHIPLVDDDNRPVGLVAVKKIIHYVVEHYSSTIYNQPPAPDQFPDSPEGA